MQLSVFESMQVIAVGLVRYLVSRIAEDDLVVFLFPLCALCAWMVSHELTRCIETPPGAFLFGTALPYEQMRAVRIE